MITLIVIEFTSAWLSERETLVGCASIVRHHRIIYSFVKVLIYFGLVKNQFCDASHPQRHVPQPLHRVFLGAHSECSSGRCLQWRDLSFDEGFFG